MNPVQELTLEQRVEVIERQLAVMRRTLEHLMQQGDLLINYAQSSAQLQGLVAQARVDYGALEAEAKRLVQQARELEQL